MFKGFSLKFSSYHRHKHANLDKLILLFSRATFNTVIKAAMCRNISIQICKTQGKQIVLWAEELTKPSFLWICILCLLLYPITAVTVLITVLLSPVTSLITMCQILQPDYYTTPHVTYLLAGVEATYAVVVAEQCGAMPGGCCQRVGGEEIAFKNSTDCEAESVTFVLFSLFISCHLKKSSRISL